MVDRLRIVVDEYLSVIESIGILLFLLGFIFLLLHWFLFLLYLSDLDALLCLFSFLDVLWSWYSSLMTHLWVVATAWFFLIIYWIVLCVHWGLFVSSVLSFCWLLWSSLLYLRWVYAETLVVVTVLSANLLLQHFLLLLSHLLWSLYHLHTLYYCIDWMRSILCWGNRGIIPDGDEVLNFP